MVKKIVMIKIMFMFLSCVLLFFAGCSETKSPPLYLTQDKPISTLQAIKMKEPKVELVYLPKAKYVLRYSVWGFGSTINTLIAQPSKFFIFCEIMFINREPLPYLINLEDIRMRGTPALSSVHVNRIGIALPKQSVVHSNETLKGMVYFEIYRGFTSELLQSEVVHLNRDVYTLPYGVPE